MNAIKLNWFIKLLIAICKINMYKIINIDIEQWQCMTKFNLLPQLDIAETDEKLKIKKYVGKFIWI